MLEVRRQGAYQQCPHTTRPWYPCWMVLRAMYSRPLALSLPFSSTWKSKSRLRSFAKVNILQLTPAACHCCCSYWCSVSDTKAYCPILCLLPVTASRVDLVSCLVAAMLVVKCGCCSPDSSVVPGAQGFASCQALKWGSSHHERPTAARCTGRMHLGFGMLLRIILIMSLSSHCLSACTAYQCRCKCSLVASAAQHATA